MPSLSAVSFIYNEERTIELCCEAIRPFVEEILFVDLESTDRTVEIARQFDAKIITRPLAICGDEHKILLREVAQGDWLLWVYPDEIIPEKTMSAMREVVKIDDYTSYSFMRHEYMDGHRLMPHGTPESPNYQNRLHKKCPEIFYTGLVHAEIHYTDNGHNRNCPMPADYYMEHRKTSKAQEFDNQRLYVYYHYLSWLHGDTQVEPFREYVSSYRQIIHDSEAKNLTGERGIGLAEEFWWDWRKHAHRPRVTLEQFKEIVGVEYPEFLKARKAGGVHSFEIKDEIIDRALREQEEAPCD